jgi:hypothetical protein
MKKHFLFALITAAVMMCLSACCKDDLMEVIDTKPVIIESEITDGGTGGVNSKVSVNDGLKTTELSYQSWIRVRGKTKADFDDKITVEINGELPDIAMEVNREFTVDAFTNVKPTVSISTDMTGTRKSEESEYVTICDSLLSYDVDCRFFFFRFEMSYEVPIYQDTVTYEVMPHYRYENIVDKGYTIEPQDSKVKDGIAYGCALLRYEIDVTFGGEVYTLCANITLLKELGPASEPYIVRSSIKSVSVEEYEQLAEVSVNVEQLWSDGRTHLDVNIAKLLGYIDKNGVSLTPLEGEPQLSYQGVSLVDETLNMLHPKECFYIAYRSVEYALDYGDIVLPFTVYAEEAYYDDCILMAELPGNGIVSVEKINETIEMNTSVGLDGKTRDNYLVTAKVKVTFEQYSREIELSGIASYVRD